MKSKFCAATLAVVALASCEPSGAPKAASTTTRPAPTAEERQEALRLTQVTVHRVKLPYVHKLRGPKGEAVEHDQAWLVMFDLENLGQPRDAALDFHVGDYRIPEYGRAPSGIYFRIYDESLLRSLQDKEISFDLAKTGKTSLGKKFPLPELEKLPLEEEAETLKKPPK